MSGLNTRDDFCILAAYGCGDLEVGKKPRIPFSDPVSRALVERVYPAISRALDFVEAAPEIVERVAAARDNLVLLLSDNTAYFSQFKK